MGKRHGCGRVINFQEILIERFMQDLKMDYHPDYSGMKPEYTRILENTARLVLGKIGNSDNLYHDVEHTVNATLVGMNILKGKRLLGGDVTPLDGVHYILALLCHDIGYVRGVCLADQPGKYATGRDGQTVTIDDDWTDSALTPYHVDRSKRFVFEHLGNGQQGDFLDSAVIAEYIEMTRFPIPEGAYYQDTSGYAGLVRAADFIGQLGDPNYLRKIPALFYEFEESGVNKTVGYQSPGHMRRAFKLFYGEVVLPYIGDAIQYMNASQKGKQWIANLYTHLRKVEQDLIASRGDHNLNNFE